MGPKFDDSHQPLIIFGIVTSLSRPVELHSPVSNSLICFKKHARVQLKQKHHFNVCLHNNKQTDVNFSDFFFFSIRTQSFLSSLFRIVKIQKAGGIQKVFGKRTSEISVGVGSSLEVI